MSDYVDPYPGRKGSERIVVECGRCGGSGLYVGPTNATFYTRTVGDTAPGCFGCKGTGEHSFLVSSARAKSRRHAREAAAAAERAAQVQARHDAFWAKHGELCERVTQVRDALRPGDPICRRLGAALEELQGTSLTDEFDDGAWAERARLILAEFDEREAAKRPVPVGRIEITGTIVSAKYVDGSYGSVLKMLVEGDGWKVWGSVPRNVSDGVCMDFYGGGRDRSLDGIAVWTQELVGREITFTAMIKASDDDPSFGFATRPTKAVLAPREADEAE